MQLCLSVQYPRKYGGLEAVILNRLLDKKVLPTLGITWSNQLLMRLMVSRTRFSLQEWLPGLAAQPWHLGSVLRTMEVVFAPHLPQSFCYYTVSIDGVRGIKEEPAS
ncbi:UNVERIFIED_CONTAM: hypothetical protein FKN15_071645 [Acipenser sinensis]